jgi:hypothetical protein
MTDEKKRARQKMKNALASIEEYRNILEATLPVDDCIEWEDLVTHDPYPEHPPRLEGVISSDACAEEKTALRAHQSVLVDQTKSAGQEGTH